jgi:hypothetical protein
VNRVSFVAPGGARDEFRTTALATLEAEYGRRVRRRAERAAVRPDERDLFGEAEAAGLRPIPANASEVARRYARRLDR